MISKLFLWAGVASLNRHDHASGTLTPRPSMRRKVINSSVIETSLTLASVLTAMLTPCLLNFVQVCLNHRSNLVKLSSRETMILSQRNRLNPELTDHSFSSDVDVRRFVAVEAVKVEPMRTGDVFNSGHTRHRFPLLQYNKSVRRSMS